MKAAPINPYVCTLTDNVEDPDMSFAAVYQHCNALSISFNKHIQRALIILPILYNDVFGQTEVDGCEHFSVPKRHINEAFCASSYFSADRSREKQQRRG